MAKNRVEMGNGTITKVCAVYFAIMLFVGAIVLFPLYKQPEPSPSVALFLSLVPISIVFFNLPWVFLYGKLRATLNHATALYVLGLLLHFLSFFVFVNLFLLIIRMIHNEV